MTKDAGRSISVAYSKSTKVTKVTKVGMTHMKTIFVRFVSFVDRAIPILDRRASFALHRAGRAAARRVPQHVAAQ
jgi:hypothetical protein